MASRWITSRIPLRATQARARHRAHQAVALGTLGLLAMIAATALATGPARAEEEKVVHVYSWRQPFLLRPLLEAFTRETGIRVKVAFARKGLLERLKAEGANTGADLVLASDVSRLAALKEAGLLRAVDSERLRRDVPAHLRDPDDTWFALSRRARIIVAHRQRVGREEVRDYEDLAAPHMKGRVCMRSGRHPYNVALFASFIAHRGEAWTERYLRALKANLARKPQGNDRAQARAIHEGQCDVAIINTYYLGKMATNDKKPEQKRWVASLRVVFPNQSGRGTHVNISGGAVARHARHPRAALRLLEFLAGEKAQRIYAAVNHEYPVRRGVPLSDMVRSWGAFREDTLPLARVAAHVPAAARLVNITGLDN